MTKFRVGEEINVPLESFMPVEDFERINLIQSEWPKKHFVITEINHAERSITLASALVGKPRPDNSNVR